MPSAPRGLLLLALASGASAWRVAPHVHRAPRAATAARAAPRLVEPQPRGKGSGYYVRLSAALERGGGFYVPGLEGYRLRLLVAAVLGGALVLNRVLSPGTPGSSQAISELLGATGCAVLLYQVVTDEEQARVEESNARRAAAIARLEELTELSPALAAAVAQRAKWAAAALLRLTPACAVLWLGKGSEGSSDDEVLLRFGRFDDAALSAEVREGGAALRRLLGGAAEAEVKELGEERLPLLPTGCGSLVLRSCAPGVLVVASEQPGAFTDKHKAWIGQLGRLLAQGA